jgi:hypothetical protein
MYLFYQRKFNKYKDMSRRQKMADENIADDKCQPFKGYTWQDFITMRQANINTIIV